MRYLFDTDHIVFLQRRASREFAAINRRVALHPAADFAFSVVSFHEQVMGAHDFVIRAKSVNDVVRGYRMLADLMSDYLQFTVLPFDIPAAAEFARLRALPVRIKTMDLRIAAVALANNLTLLTRNAKDFAKVPGLVIEDWTL